MAAHGPAVAALLAALIAFSPPAASAQPELAKADAEAKLQEGAALLDRGEYQGALDRFAAAYKIFPSPKIYFNVGLAYRGLGRHADALDAFEKFVKEVPGSDLRAEALREIADLQPRVASLEVWCDVEGAEVIVDGHSLGATPLGRPVRLAAGPHLILVQRAGLDSHTQRFQADGGSTVRLEARIARLPSAAPAPPTIAPAPVPPPAPPPMLSQKAAAPAPEPDSRPVYSRWWLWAIVGGLVVAGTAVFVLTRPSSDMPGCPMGATCH